MDPHASARSKFGPPPEDWEECVTDEGDPYWYNRKTKSSRWFHPLDPTVLNDEGSARNLRKSKSLSSYDSKRQSEPEPRIESKEKKEKTNSLRLRAKTFLSKIVHSKSKDSKSGVEEEHRSLSASPSLESPKPKPPLETEKPKSPREKLDKSPKDKSPRSVSSVKSPKSDGSKKEKKSKKSRRKSDAWEKNQTNTNDAFRTFRKESKKRLKESEDQRKARIQREVDALFEDIKTDNHGRLLPHEEREYKKIPKTREEITLEAREKTLRAIRSRRKL